jgi:hypothetical protein
MNIDPPTSQSRGKSGILAILTDSQRELKIRDDNFG